ncbi:hypothetical protein QFZ82_000131 [Streptomyces sp. V4I23]|uniref:collagen-binding domain-containing protein n=1 Tax=Streptomyces sp. V4I23 TaxID=3042282 RepID=UPI0027839157|nr:collagen-binding domain-containing protein [Streptomyces sp. V4I23]MDQ1005647.1 hypothetical protein [Streptomyces sp. V4I23]
MRMTARSVVLALSGSMALGTFSLAVSAPPAGPQCAQRLGVARQYSDVVAGDTVHSPDSDGAVVIGGDADFTAGSKLTDAEVDALPGKAILVVAGDFVHSDAVRNPGAAEALAGRVVKGPPPLDIRGAFRGLRALSQELAEAETTPGAIAVLRGTGAPVNGTVVARALKATGGAETRHVPFGGYLPTAPTPTPTPTSTRTPTITPSPVPSTTRPAPSPTPSSPGGSLADTGNKEPGLILGSALALIGAGALVNTAVRRRKNRRHH